MPPENFKDVIDIFVELIYYIVPVLAGAALLVFVWGLVKFISNASDVKAQTEGKQLIIWGLVALFVMVSVEGILSFALEDTLDRTLGIPFLPEPQDK